MSMKAVIMAGGKGTRLRPLTEDKIPKAMFPLCGKPIIDYQIDTLYANGVRDFIIVVGHLGRVIKSHIGDGSEKGITVTYYEEIEPLGTAGALFKLRDQLTGTFLLVLGDILFDIDLERFYDFHKATQGDISLLAHPNSHPFDSDILVMGECGRVIRVLPKDVPRDFWYDNCVNAGLYLMESSLLTAQVSTQTVDLDKDIVKPAIEGNPGVYAYRTPEYIKDAGTPERVTEVEASIKAGIVQGKNLKFPQRACFLDRDGTINQHVGLLQAEEQFVLQKSAAQAISRLNQAGYLVIVVTNQPVVARGMCQIEDVTTIHRKMETLLGEQGAFVDDIFFCPHHPDSGYPEENPIYKIACDCRKPKTGMVMEATKRYHIDLEASWFIGDTTMDIQTGQNAGTRTALVKTGEGGSDGKYQAKPNAICADLLEAVHHILAMEQ